MAVSYGNDISFYKNKGLVSEVFTAEIMEKLPEGDIALGHVRYSGEYFTSFISAQPTVFNGKHGKFAVAFNGKITNANELRKQLIADGNIFQTNVEVEVIGNLINKYSQKDYLSGILEAVKHFEGSFALVVMTTNQIIAMRDRFGLRPLIFGKCCEDYVVSSESCALDATGVDVIRDIEAGEIVVFDAKGTKSYFMDNIDKKPCIFEYVYTARADSVIDGTSVYHARFECGVALAKKLKIKADIVAGVPDSAVVAARGYASESKIPYVDVFEKNRYVGRTFIQPNQLTRENSVRIKLNVHKANIQGKSIILIDDSIVRGTTCKKIVDLLKRSGAKEVHLVIASPVVAHPCYTGIDIETYDQLIGAKNSVKEICKILGADSLHYIDVEDLVNCCKSDKVCNFCCACFDGKYPDDIENKVLNCKE
ncbi:MAG: amidophosphoribosyltransferase, partial [Clostridia bacterium]